MSREHELGYSIYQLARVLQYLYKSLPLDDNRVNAIDLILVAQGAVRSEYMLLETVRVYKETHRG